MGFGIAQPENSSSTEDTKQHEGNTNFFAFVSLGPLWVSNFLQSIVRQSDQEREGRGREILHQKSRREKFRLGGFRRILGNFGVFRLGIRKIGRWRSSTLIHWNHQLRPRKSN